MSLDSDEQSDGLVVYKQDDDDDDAENEDIWDDTALIKMYDRAITQTYDKLGEESVHAVSAKKKPCKTQWRAGDHCMAPYYSDQLWYPAVVQTVDVTKGTCQVLYDVYDELAEVELVDLTSCDNSAAASAKRTDPPRSHDSGSDLKPDDFDVKTHINSSPIPLHMPPPPIAFSKVSPADGVDEALSNMLMSWYMSGYHSGYYQALQDAKTKKATTTTSTTNNA